MYIYRDTNESLQDTQLPAEALCIDGKWLEEEITGYRTLSTSGRDMLGRNLLLTDMTRRDGSFFRYRKFPERVIHVEFQILASDSEEYRAKFNRLNQLLNVEDAELIFADEPDKCFYGTPSEVYPPEPGLDNVKGAFDITCVDPYKYSREEFVVSGKAGNLQIDYQGAFPAYPILEALFPPTGLLGSCKYVAFVNDDNKVIKIGSTETSAESAETLVNTFFYSDPINLLYCNDDVYCGESLRAGNDETWAQNACSFFQEESYEITGDFYIENLADGKRMICPQDYGTGVGWHGPAVSYLLPAPSSGDSGSRNFGFSFLNRISVSDLEERGIFTATVNAIVDNVYVEVASFSLEKSEDGTAFDMHFSVNGERMRTVSTLFDSGKQVSIMKDGETITFLANGNVYTFYSEAVAELEASQIGFFFGSWADSEALTENGLVWARFTDGLVQLAENDVVSADCKNAEIYVNNVLRQDLGAIGNDWEEFMLVPGLNNIVAVVGKKAKRVSPSFRIRYREVYI